MGPLWLCFLKKITWCSLCSHGDAFRSGVQVSKREEKWGSFKAREEPYEFKSEATEVPSGALKRGTMDRRITFTCREGCLLGPICRKFTIAQKK